MVLPVAVPPAITSREGNLTFVVVNSDGLRISGCLAGGVERSEALDHID